MPSALVPVIIVLVVAVVAVVLFKLMWRVAEPNEAMIISGLSAKAEGSDDTPGPRVIVGKGAFVIPGVQQVRYLKLDQHSADLYVDCVTSQGIPVQVKGVVIYKIANDLGSIANAAQRYLGQQQTMDQKVHNVFAGHLRSIIGGLTIEDLISDRQKLETETRKSSMEEMQTLGFQLDSLKIQEIDDPTHYIDNLSKPHIASVERAARIAEASNNREAAQQEAEAAAQVAEAQRTTEIKQANYSAEVQRAQATASQAGPLAEATAKQGVVEQETEVATLEAQRQEAVLNATVRKKADADKYATVTQAEGQRQAAILGAEAESESTKLRAGANAEQTRLMGEAEGDAIAAKGKAEGDTLRARAEGLAANQEAVISQQLAGMLPEIVKNAAGAFEHVDNMTVLNGGQGLMEVLASVMTQGGETLKLIRSALKTDEPSHNGHSTEADKFVGPRS